MMGERTVMQEALFFGSMVRQPICSLFSVTGKWFSRALPKHLIGKRELQAACYAA